jgi:hypothetical protein
MLRMTERGAEPPSTSAAAGPPPPFPLRLPPTLGASWDNQGSAGQVVGTSRRAPFFNSSGGASNVDAREQGYEGVPGRQTSYRPRRQLPEAQGSANDSSAGQGGRDDITGQQGRSTESSALRPRPKPARWQQQQQGLSQQVHQESTQQEAAQQQGPSAAQQLPGPPAEVSQAFKASGRSLSPPPKPPRRSSSSFGTGSGSGSSNSGSASQESARRGQQYDGLYAEHDLRYMPW